MQLLSIVIVISGILGYNFINENVLKKFLCNWTQNQEKDNIKNQQDKKSKRDSKEEAIDNDSENKNKENSIFNFCSRWRLGLYRWTEDTVDNIIDQDPELVLALGHLSYNDKAECWLIS